MDINTVYYIHGPWRDRKEFVLFYMCHLWALHVVITFYIYRCRLESGVKERGRYGWWEWWVDKSEKKWLGLVQNFWVGWISRSEPWVHVAVRDCSLTNRNKRSGMRADFLVIIIGSRPSDHHFRSVCWFVCLFVCAEFLSRLWSNFDKTRTYVIRLGLVVSPII